VKTVSQYLAEASPELRAIYDSLDTFLMALGDDVTMKTAKYYLAYRRIKNFACVESAPAKWATAALLESEPGRGRARGRLHSRCPEHWSLRDR
jgi:hypothetical protein